MEALAKEVEKLEARANLGTTVNEVQRIIDELKNARASVQAEPKSAPMTLAKLQSPVKQSFDKINDNLKDIYKNLGSYSKAINAKFKETTLPFADNDAISSQPSLINRAIAMHLLREGLFDVASTFIKEANAKPPAANSTAQDKAAFDDEDAQSADAVMEIPSEQNVLSSQEAWEADFAPTAYKSAALQQQFGEMYHIVHEMRHNQNFAPAINWAHTHSAVLEARGSNLEFDLCAHQYLVLLTSRPPPEGALAAITYARTTFPHFPPRYTSQINQLMGAIAYAANLTGSPYHQWSQSAHDLHSTSAIASSFTSEFCALLSLSSASPLLTAVTAGCIALPTLQKFNQIQAAHRTSWTTTAELPVEVPLPPAYSFHSVFVCPVSKDQATDANPPMMMPCGHVVAKQSLDSMSKGARFKCPYCPQESHPNEALRVYL